MSLSDILTGQTSEHLIEFENHLINRQIIRSFIALQEEAKKAGFLVAIASGFRNFERQLSIWNAKFNGALPLLDSRCELLDSSQLNDEQKIVAILRWSALPGASRHHWGTDLDLYARNLLPKNTSLLLEPWEYFSGHQAPFYAWLKTQAQNFGFFFPYAEDKGGIAIEPWHISHQTWAKKYQNALSVELLQDCISSAKVAGKETVIDMLPDIYSRFITNISTPMAEPAYLSLDNLPK